MNVNMYDGEALRLLFLCAGVCANKVSEHFEQQAMRERRHGTSKYAIERPEPAGGERLLLLRAPCVGPV